MKQYFAVGMYTEPILFGTGELFQGKGTGIAICEFDGGKIRVLKEIKIQNPSFLCMDEGKRKIYAVNELKEFQGQAGGGITQLSYDECGNMAVEKTCSTKGTDPCHVAAAPNGEFLSVTNFASGSVMVFQLDSAGSIQGECGFFQHEGSSVHPLRQKGPHAHSTVFGPDGSYMMVPDLGLDEVVVYRYSGSQVEADNGKNYHVASGNGPRFGEFDRSGQNFYLINELGSQVMHCHYAAGKLTGVEAVTTLPEGYHGENICSDLHLTPDGKFLYASNRGHDSLACYRVNPDGGLHLTGHSGCGGKTPRNFAIEPSGRYLLAGNQDSDNITVFKIDGDGGLKQISQAYFGSPVCIRFFQKTIF